MSINFPSADFAPTLSGYTGQGPFRFWCQKVLPIVYDDSLSYYELLNKVVVYLNNVINDFGTMVDNLDEVVDTFNELQDWVNQYLDLDSAVAEQLDKMAENGELERVFGNLIQAEIDRWLDLHPEATTTVQDGALTEAKFSESLKLLAIKDYTAPEMFGGVGDGIADDTDAVEQCIAVAEAKKCGIYLTKEYKVNRPLIVDGDSVTFFISPGEIISTITTGIALLIDGGTNKHFSCRVVGTTYNGGYQFNNYLGNFEYENLDLIGIRFSRVNRSVIECEVRDFHIGCQFYSPDNGVVFNTVTFHSISDNVIGCHLLCDGHGWINDNLFLNGNFTVSSTNTDGLKATSLRLEGSALHGINNNKFIKNGFEGGCLAIALKYAKYNYFDCVRFELGGGIPSDNKYLYKACDGSATFNDIFVGYLGAFPKYYPNEYGGSIRIITPNIHNTLNTTQLFEWNYEKEKNSICKLKGSTYYRQFYDKLSIIASSVAGGVIPNISSFENGFLTTNKTAWTIGDNGLSSATNDLIGVVVKTNDTKHFIVNASCDASCYAIMCFDANGNAMALTETVDGVVVNKHLFGCDTMPTAFGSALGYALRTSSLSGSISFSINIQSNDVKYIAFVCYRYTNLNHFSVCYLPETRTPSAYVSTPCIVGVNSKLGQVTITNDIESSASYLPNKPDALVQDSGNSWYVKGYLKVGDAWIEDRLYQ